MPNYNFAISSHILIVDDNPINLDLLLDYFDTLHMNVSVAEGGERALEICQRDKPDLILMDVMMPNMDGFETCEQLKQNPDTQNIPVIFMTALTDMDSKMSGFYAGGVDYITKPFVIEEVAARVSTHLNLYHLQTSLENRVKERTSDLEKSNVRLRKEVMDRARAESEVQQKMRQMILIHEIEMKIASVLDVDLLVKNAVDLLTTTFDYHHVALFFIDDQLSIVQLKAVAGWYKDYFAHGHTQPLSTGIIGWVASNGSLLLANDVTVEPRFISMISSHNKTKSELCLPIKIDGRVVGVIDIQSPELNAFTEGDVLALEILANQVAVAIVNAQLHQDLKDELQEHAQTAVALKASEERYRLVSETVSDFAFAAYITADRKVEVEWITDAFYRITGYDLVDLDAELFDTLIHPDDRAYLSEKLTEIGDSQEKKLLDLRIMTRAGDTRWLQTYLQFISNDNDKLYVLGAARDITEQKQLQDAMYHTQKLESLGVLAGGIAHDFNNLLTAMMNESALALLKMSQDSPGRPHIGKVLKVTERAASLTRQMLNYSGHAQFEKTTLALNRVIEDNLSLLEATVPRSVTLVSDLLPESPMIEADAGQIQQVVMNLIINAAESYSGQNGRVLVTTAVVDLAPNHNQKSVDGEGIAPGRYASLIVTDQGQGMSRETVRKVFEPFFTTKVSGRGLGLAAVLSIVKGFGGAIQVTSELGIGTTFTVLFPTVEKSETGDIEPTAVDQQLAATILLVDDEPVIRESFAEMLALKGLSVWQANDGHQAIKQFHKHQYEIDLVIMDVTMPNLNGTEAMMEMHRERPDLPVILLSGYGFFANKFDIDESHKHIAFLKKPVPFMTLLNTVQRLLGTSEQNDR